MNLHVVIVHFPIALLTLYSLLELISFGRIRQLSYLFYIKAFLVVLGAGSAFASMQTGKMIAGGFLDHGRLLQTHALFGTITTYYFGIAGLVYLIAFLGRSGWGRIAKPAMYAEKMLGSWCMPFVGLAGLIIITITGALGGSIAFGPDIDPVARFIYDLFGF